MTVKISYSTKASKNLSSNSVLFVNDKFNINSLKKYFSNSEFSYINDLLKNSDLKKNIFVYEVSSKKKIILVSIKNNLKTCLLYTSPSPRDGLLSRMPSSA